MTQYSIRPMRSAIRPQNVYFLQSTMPSITCLRLSDVSVICRVTYFQFPIQSALLPYADRQPHQHCIVLLVLIRNIGHQTLSKIWVGTVLVRNVQLGERLRVASRVTVKMETRHPLESQFGSEFPAICNHCRVMAA